MTSKPPLRASRRAASPLRRNRPVRAFAGERDALLSGSCDTRLARPCNEIVAAVQHVLQRAELVHVVARKTFVLDPAEHCPEIDIALAGPEMHLDRPKTIGEPHFAAARKIQRVDEAGDAFRP